MKLFKPILQTKYIMSFSTLIIDKTGIIKPYTIKKYNEEELYKKCGFKKADGFLKQTTWNVSLEGEKYAISMYGKLDGKANTENKYDFPPPIDSKLYFGSCLIIGMVKDIEGKFQFISMTRALWEKIYEKLMGGFEDLNALTINDDDESDELENIPKSKKTKQGGYLKDGFVVDDSASEDDEYSDSETSSVNDTLNKVELELEPEELCIEDIGSEISEEEYEYSDNE